MNPLKSGGSISITASVKGRGSVGITGIVNRYENRFVRSVEKAGTQLAESDVI